LLDTTAAIDFWNAAVKPAMVCSGSRPCENAKAINRDRTTYSFKIVFRAHIARAFNFEVERKILVIHMHLIALRQIRHRRLFSQRLDGRQSSQAWSKMTQLA
jgi:hypothetical protein